MAINASRLPTIECDRVNLRWIENADAPSIFAIFSNPTVTRYWSTPPMQSVTDAETQIKSIKKWFQQHRLYQWGVELRETNNLIGTTTLASLDWQNRRAELGFALHSDYWGRGLMTEGLNQLLDFAFESLNLNRLEADIDPRNDASKAVIDRLGFEREGYMPQRWIVNDEVCDTEFFGLLAQNWRDRRR